MHLICAAKQIRQEHNASIVARQATAQKTFSNYPNPNPRQTANFSRATRRDAKTILRYMPKPTALLNINQLLDNVR